MLASVVIILIALIIMIIEIPSLSRNQLIRELIAFMALLVFGTVISILHVLKIQLPRPHDWIAFIYKPLSEAIYSFLK